MQTSKIITLFIHGTLPPNAVLKIPVVNFFFCYPRGLSRAEDLNEKYQTRRLINAFCTSDPLQFDVENFYLFGWSGYLRFSERLKAAEELYKHLQLLKMTYEARGIKPLFKLVTHSHGGNVALHLAQVVKNDPQHVISIEELILLACPVQVETASLVNEPVFKKVFSVHSHHDILQILDPQGIHLFTESLKQHGLEFTVKHLKRLGPVFSARHFLAEPNVIQLNVRYPNRELFHIEFLSPAIFSALPPLITMMKELKKTSASKADDMTFIINPKSQT